jgi:hypothetical protein
MLLLSPLEGGDDWIKELGGEKQKSSYFTSGIANDRQSFLCYGYNSY